MEEKRYPGVGMGIFVFKDGKFLMGIRKNPHGIGKWALPGGKLEFNEELEDCARREVKEETGLEIKNIRFKAITNDMFKNEDKHNITIFMISDWLSGEPRVMEPNKCEEWKWISKDNIPEPLFLPLINLRKRGLF